MIRASGWLAAGIAWILCVAPAGAASPLAMLPVGKSAAYRLTSQTQKPPAGGGSSSTNNVVRIVRSSVGTFDVSVDGAPAGQITLDANGAPVVPPQLQKIMAPFGLVGVLMRGAPQPLAANSSWAANVPVPLDGTTDNVATTVSVENYSANGATIAASGQNTTSVQPLVRQKPAAVKFSATMIFSATGMLTNAASNVAIAIKAGRLRTQNAGSSWTLALTGP